MGKYSIHGGEKKFLQYQLRAYHGFSELDLKSKTVKELRGLMR